MEDYGIWQKGLWGQVTPFTAEGLSTPVSDIKVRIRPMLPLPPGRERSHFILLLPEPSFPPFIISGVYVFNSVSVKVSENDAEDSTASPKPQGRPPGIRRARMGNEAKKGVLVGSPNPPFQRRGSRSLLQAPQSPVLEDSSPPHFLKGHSPLLLLQTASGKETIRKMLPRTLPGHSCR